MTSIVCVTYNTVAVPRKTLTILSLTGLLLCMGLLAATSYAPLLSITFGTLIASAVTVMAVLATKLVGKLRATRDRRFVLATTIVLGIIAVLAAYWGYPHIIAAYRWHHPLLNREAKRTWLEDIQTRLRAGDATLLRETWEKQESVFCPQAQRYGIRKILLSVIETPGELDVPEFHGVEVHTEIPGYGSWTGWIDDNWDRISPRIEHHLDELKFDSGFRKYKLHQD